MIQALQVQASQIAVLAMGDNAGLSNSVQYFKADIRDPNSVRAALQELQPDIIFHLAGISAVDVSWKNPRVTYEVNVLGTHNLLEAAMNLPSPPKILNVSTSQVYAAGNTRLTEDSPTGPDNPYAVSKLMAELLILPYRKYPDGGIITARPFNHTGPGQPSNFVISAIAKQFAEIEAGLRPPKLALGNIEVVRDFTDVRDVVRAYCMLLEKGRKNEVYNVCSGSAVSLSDVIRMFEKASGLKVPISVNPEKLRSSESTRVCGNPARVHVETGWSTQIPLQQTVSDLLNYWQSNLSSPHTGRNLSKQTLS